MHGVSDIYVIVDEGGNNVILQKLILSVADRPDLELDLKGFLLYSIFSRTHSLVLCMYYSQGI